MYFNNCIHNFVVLILLLLSSIIVRRVTFSNYFGQSLDLRYINESELNFYQWQARFNIVDGSISSETFMFSIFILKIGNARRTGTL